MKKEQLFLAIGGLEAERLEKTEEPVKKKSVTKVPRRLLLAAAIAAALAGGVCAAAGFQLFGSSEEVVQELYGGEESLDATTVTTNNMGVEGSYVRPGYEQQALDETTAQELAQFISPVGLTLENDNYKVTVDAYLYDSVTKAGFLTLSVECSQPFGDLDVSDTGNVEPGMLRFNQYGYSYLLSDKCTDTTMVIAYYFQTNIRSSSVFTITLADSDGLDAFDEIYQEQSDYIAECMERLQQELTEEEAEAALRELWGDELVDETYAGREDQISATVYSVLADEEEAKRTQDNKLIIDLQESGNLPTRSFGDGDAVINSLSVQVYTEKYNPAGSLNVLLNMADGTTFVVASDEIENTRFRRQGSDGRTLNMLNSVLNIDDVVSIELSFDGKTVTLLPDDTE